jgi:hypothetical protein
MSVASLNLYHHGKHYVHPVPKWLSRLCFFIIPKLLCMNIKLPIRLQKRRMGYNSSQNGRIITPEGLIENPNHHRLSVPLILRSYASKSTENSRLKFSFDYIHHLIEQNERRCEQQEHNAIIGQEWQILGRVIDRLFVMIFLIGTMFVFGFIFSRAPHLRLK